MEKKGKQITNNENAGFLDKKISRKEAIKKTGYVAASAATMMILLSKNAEATSGGSLRKWQPQQDPNCPQASGGASSPT